jgi:hypothetical protein
MTSADQGPPLARLLAGGSLPEREVYFFLDPTTSNEQNQWRICRVGPNAVNLRSKSTLRARLRAHLDTRSGSGNHRPPFSSPRRQRPVTTRPARDCYLGYWHGRDECATHERLLCKAEARHEQQVSIYIGQLPVLWLAVLDEASPPSERRIIEQNAISLLSQDAQRNAVPPNGWLDEHSPRREIRESHLWNLITWMTITIPAFLRCSSARWRDALA